MQVKDDSATLSSPDAALPVGTPYRSVKSASGLYAGKSVYIMYAEHQQGSRRKATPQRLNAGHEILLTEKIMKI